MSSSSRPDSSRNEARSALGCDHLGDQLSPSGRYLLLDVVQHHITCDRIEHDLAADGKNGKPCSTFGERVPCDSNPSAPGSVGRSGTLCVGGRRSPARSTQSCPAPSAATAELLKKDRRALGGSQEQHRIDVGDVEALIEQVDGEDDVELAIAEPSTRHGGHSASVSAETASAGMPNRSNCSAMYFTCSTLTQNPRARIAWTSSTLSLSSLRMIRVRASLPV